MIHKSFGNGFVFCLSLGMGPLGMAVGLGNGIATSVVPSTGQECSYRALTYVDGFVP